jgi:hypothetical protein
MKQGIFRKLQSTRFQENSIVSHYLFATTAAPKQELMHGLTKTTILTFFEQEGKVEWSPLHRSRKECVWVPTSLSFLLYTMNEEKRVTNIDVGVLVETRKKPRQTGLVLQSLENSLWLVRMENDNEEVVLNSNRLRIVDYRDPVDILNGTRATSTNSNNTSLPPLPHVESVSAVAASGSEDGGVSNVRDLFQTMDVHDQNQVYHNTYNYDYSDY